MFSYIIFCRNSRTSNRNDSCEYDVGNYKVFKINPNASGLSEDVKTFINIATISTAKNNKLDEFANYYGEPGNNKGFISQYFQKQGASGEYYFTVANKGVEAYDGVNIDTSISEVAGNIEY